MPPKPAPSRALAYLLLVLTALFWSGNWVVGRWIRNDVPPIALSFWRWVIAFLCLSPWALPHLRAQWRDVLGNWKILALLGLFGGACHNALTYIGLARTTATNGVLLASATPIMIIGLSWALLGKKLRLAEWIGVMVSFSGVLTILVQGKLGHLMALRPNDGDLWVLAAMLFWALYTVLLAWRPAGLHALTFLSAITLWGLAGLAPFYLWEIAMGRHIVPGGPAIGAIVYAGIFPAALGFIFWNRAVAEVGSNRAGQFMHLMPAFGILLSMAFLGEKPEAYHFAGISLILFGIFLAGRN